MNAQRNAAIANATAWFDGGGLFDELSRRVGIRTESQDRECAQALGRYLTEEIGPAAERLGFRTEIWDNPVSGAPPFLFAERVEDSALPTVLTYGHGDVVAGHDHQWSERRSPWKLTQAGACPSITSAAARSAGTAGALSILPDKPASLPRQIQPAR